MNLQRICLLCCILISSSQQLPECDSTLQFDCPAMHEICLIAAGSENSKKCSCVADVIQCLVIGDCYSLSTKAKYDQSFLDFKCSSANLFFVNMFVKFIAIGVSLAIFLY